MFALLDCQLVYVIQMSVASLLSAEKPAVVGRLRIFKQDRKQCLNQYFGDTF